MGDTCVEEMHARETHRKHTRGTHTWGNMHRETCMERHAWGIHAPRDMHATPAHGGTTIHRGHIHKYT